MGGDHGGARAPRGHQQRAAAELGISPSTLYRRLRRGG
ncbi:helix-turn-helix domain-containing protein [Nannocystis pusilla]